jgi:hypothetical protein
MDAERMSCDRGGELPTEEFPAEVVAIRQVQSKYRMPGPLQRDDGSIQRGIAVAFESKRRKSIGSVGGRGGRGSATGTIPVPSFPVLSARVVPPRVQMN